VSKSSSSSHFPRGWFDQKIVKKSQSRRFFAPSSTRQATQKNFQASSSRSGKSLFPHLRRHRLLLRVVCEEDKDKDEDKKKRSTPSLRVHLFLRLFFVSRSFFFRGGEEI
jgi:hypothetical protein